MARPRTKCAAPRPRRSPAASAGWSRSAASAARPSPWPRAQVYRRRQRLLQEDARRPMRRSRRPTVQAAMQQWLSRPAFSVRLEPGDRPPYVEAKGAEGEDQGRRSPSRRRRCGRCRRSAQTPPLDFPDVQHVTLSNGVKLHYAQRSAVPVTQLALSFDAGYRGRRAGRPRPAEHDAEPARRRRRRPDVASRSPRSRSGSAPRSRASGTRRPVARSPCRR